LCVQRIVLLPLLLLVGCPLTPPLESFVCDDDNDCAAVTGHVCGDEGTCVRGPDARTDAGAPAGDAGLDDAGLGDAGIDDDAGVDDAGVDDAGLDDAGLGDAGVEDAGVDDAGLDDAGLDDAGVDDAGLDAGDDAGGDAGGDAGLDGGADGGLDAGDGGADAGPACVQTFDELTMRCSGGLDYSCELTLAADDAGVSGAAGCIGCRVPVARQILASDDFDGPDGGCDMGGWFVAPDGCFTAIDSCNLTGSALCCDDESFFCTTELDAGGHVLKADRNCTGTREEVRLRQNFDFSGWRNVRVCFDVGDSAADNDDGVVIFARDTLTLEEQRPLCLRGNRGLDGRLGERRCVDMPVLLTDNPNAQIEFIMHSDQINDVIYVDNIEVSAVPLACPQQAITIGDPLSGCVAGGPDGGAVDGWEIVEGAIECANNFTACPDGDDVVVNAGVTTRLRRTFDTTEIDDQLQVCVWWGDVNASGGEAGELYYDTGDGLVSFRRRAGDFGTNLQCRANADCNIISFDNPEVLHHGQLVLEARLESDGQRLGIDRIEVRGIRRCELTDFDAAKIEVSDKGDGVYGVDVTRDVAAAGIDVDMVCSVPGALPGAPLTEDQRVSSP
jgi:hypothetical protein